MSRSTRNRVSRDLGRFLERELKALEKYNRKEYSKYHRSETNAFTIVYHLSVVQPLVKESPRTRVNVRTKYLATRFNDQGNLEALD